MILGGLAYDCPSNRAKHTSSDLIQIAPMIPLRILSNHAKAYLFDVIAYDVKVDASL
jgi:hypothetical protein